MAGQSGWFFLDEVVPNDWAIGFIEFIELLGLLSY
jgi:hypothetical protein